MGMDSIAETIGGDPRYVYLIVMILLFAGCLAPLSLPTVADPVVRGAYDAMEALEEGDVIIFEFKCGSANERGDAPGVEAMWRHALHLMETRGIKIITWSGYNLGEYYGDQTIKQTLGYAYPDTKDHPKYGTQWVEMGFVAGFRTAQLYDMSVDMTSIFAADRYGTPYEDVPMLADVQDGGDIALYVHGCTHGSPGSSEDLIGSFHERYGTEIIPCGEQEIITMLVSYWVIGKLAGIIYGSGAALQYERLSGIPSTANPAAGYATALFYVGWLIILGVVGVNVYQLWYKKQRE
jgi:hypothetical protein